MFCYDIVFCDTFTQLKRIGTLIISYSIIAIAFIKYINIISPAALYYIISFAAFYYVIATTAIYSIIPFSTIDSIISFISAYRVITGSAIDSIV